MNDLSAEAQRLLTALSDDSHMITPETLLPAAELVKCGLAKCYHGQDGELYVALPQS